VLCSIRPYATTRYCFLLQEGRPNPDAKPAEDIPEYLDDDPLPDARVAPRHSSNSDGTGAINIGASMGFKHVSPQAADAAATPAVAAKTVDGVPLWVVVPLAVLAGLLGLVLMAAATYFGVRLYRR
jgi:hypothetical protein